MFTEFTLIAGPCLLEDDELNLRVGERLASLRASLETTRQADWERLGAAKR